VFELKSKQDFNWAIFGKHPVAGDFLKAGHPTPVLNSFAKWMDKGHSQLGGDKESNPVLGWRFWAKGPNKELICGILQSSEDKYARKYPLLVIGSGKNPELIKNWHLIPYACEGSWQQLAKLVNKKFQNIKELKKYLKKTAAPENNIQFLVEKNEKYRNVVLKSDPKIRHSDFMNKMNNIEALTRRESFSVHIDVGDEKAPLVPVSKLFFLLKKRSSVAPQAVFWGGGGNTKSLLCLKRQLAIEDFLKLTTNGTLD